MAEIDIDTDKLKNISKEFNSASRRVNDIINEVNDLINSLSEKGVWIGPRANDFINLTRSEQRFMQSFCSSLNEYALYLDKVCNKHEGLYENYRRDDEDTHRL